MSSHVEAHAPVGGRLWTGPFKLLVAIAAIGGLVVLWRVFNGLGSVSNLNDGYPWGVWVTIDVVVGTAIGCGGFAMGLLVYVMNKGKYHPLVRPAVLTSLLGYGLAVIAVMIDLGRYWGLWKVPVFVWRWTHSPQLEVALCVAAYVLVLLVEISPAGFEKWKDSSNPTLRKISERGLTFMDRMLVWILAIGLMLPAMHQSSLGTMMLLPGPKVHPLWFTPWLPLLFLINCIMIGFAVVVLESTFSAIAFKRKRETSMLASLAPVVAATAMFWLILRVGETVISGKLGLLGSWYGFFYGIEIVLTLLGALILFAPGLRAQSSWQVRAALLLLLSGAIFRINTYLIAFTPGPNFSYFPSVPELFITFGIIAAEIAIYIAVVRTFPILGGAPAAASKK
jgi:Ni/Fe-hydrogenase subunit HybB-like protein